MRLIEELTLFGEALESRTKFFHCSNGLAVSAVTLASTDNG